MTTNEPTTNTNQDRAARLRARAAEVEREANAAPLETGDDAARWLSALQHAADLRVLARKHEQNAARPA